MIALPHQSILMPKNEYWLANFAAYFIENNRKFFGQCPRPQVSQSEALTSYLESTRAVHSAPYCPFAEVFQAGNRGFV